jgi:uncharacterized repeat protein (TIGR03803 family)
VLHIKAKHMLVSTLRLSTALVLAGAVIGLRPAWAGTPAESAIYNFAGGNDGGFPHAGLIASRAGNALYGTTSSDGTGHNGVIFKVTPPAAGQTTWTQTVLYAFSGGNDGGIPYASLLEDASGALYGTTEAGGASGQGVVFKLSPPASGKTAWTQTVLHSFSGGNDGGEPWSPLIADASGNLYGTATIGGSGVVGCVWKLTAPAAGHSAWSETVLYNFTGNADGGEPFGRVVFGPHGTLLGTSAGYGQYNYGTLYALTPPAGTGSSWRFHLLHAYHGGADGSTPRDGLIASPSGTFYGTTAGLDNSYGSVFSVAETAGGTGFSYKVLYNFGGPGFTGSGPWQTVSLDAAGNLYGTTLGDGGSADGVAFKLTPPAAGSSRWRETVLHAFQGGSDGQFLYSKPVVVGTTLYGTSEGEGSQAGFFPGTVWQITQ